MKTDQRPVVPFVVLFGKPALDSPTSGIGPSATVMAGSSPSAGGVPPTRSESDHARGTVDGPVWSVGGPISETAPDQPEANRDSGFAKGTGGGLEGTPLRGGFPLTATLPRCSAARSAADALALAVWRRMPPRWKNNHAARWLLLDAAARHANLRRPLPTNRPR